jgi:hypothetical protein
MTFKSEQCARLAQKMQVGPCIPVGIQLEKAEVGPTFGLSHFTAPGQACCRYTRKSPPTNCNAARKRYSTDYLQITNCHPQVMK